MFRPMTSDTIRKTSVERMGVGMGTSRLLQLLEENHWGPYQDLMDRLRQWSGYPLFERAARELRRDQLFVSHVHGVGHIERTLLHGAFCAMENGLNEEDTRLLLDACSYHDVGRINDWLDYEHGHRSALRLPELTPWTGGELRMLQAAVDAHSRKDRDLEKTLESYHPADLDRCRNLAELLKDSDGLDRVRIQDLDPRYLRRPGSAARASFAQYLFEQYPRHLPSLFKRGRLAPPSLTPQSGAPLTSSFQSDTLSMPTLTLRNGVTLPSTGFGTYKADDAKRVVLDALRAGYRYLDTASFYKNEEAVGQAVRESGLPRDQVFLATKLWKTEMGFQAAQRAIDGSLRRLNTDYLDVYLIHWPRPDLETTNWRELDLECWRAMEAAYHAGKIRALGVSNFLPHHLYTLIELAEVKPVVDQLEFHPGYPQKAAVDFCQLNGIQVQAWSPLGRARVMEEPLLLELARRYQRTPAQICLRFALDCGVQPLPKTSDPARMRENLEALDFTLTGGDLYQLLTLPQLGWSGEHPDRKRVR